ncbi:MAG: protein kinase [Myxococcales bacterium]|nr:protein kinase [Myxococcales bacterium]
MATELTPSFFLGVDWTGAATHRRNSAERFELVAPLGVGGFGEVWHALDTATEEHVAVKVLGHAAARAPALQAAFRQEIRAASRLAHEGVVRLFDVGTLGPEVERASSGRLVAGSPFVAMERLAQTLVPVVTRGATWERIRVITEQLLRALAHVHARGVIHLDLKPSNVMFRGDEHGPAVLTDFGIAWLAHETGAPTGTGTPGYAAPEQIVGDARGIGPWSDLYALGCIVWELVTGASPFAASSPFDRLFASPPPLVPRMPVPPELEGWLRRLLASSANARFPSAARALHELTHGLDAPLEPTLPAVTPTPPSGRGLGMGLFAIAATPLVGRDVERERLRALAADVARTGEGRSVAIVGPSGSGTTRLAEWLAELVVEHDVFDVVVVHGERSEGLREALRRQYRLAGLSLRRAIAALGEPEDWAVRAAAEVLIDDDAPDEGVLQRFLATVARRRPLLVVADANAEVPSIEGRVLLVRTGRTTLETDETIVLGELAKDDVLRLADELRFAPTARDALLSEVRAWPGDLLAHVTAWADQGRLVRRGASVELTAPTGNTKTRFDAFALRVSEAELRALEVAAFLAPSVEVLLWRNAATACDTAATWACLDRLVADGLGQVVDGVLYFESDETVEALRARARSRSSRIHHACADVLLASPWAKARDERLVRHLRAIGRDDEALEALARATEARTRVLDLARAHELAETQLTLVDALGIPEVDVRRVRAALAAGVVDRARGAIESAEAHARRAHHLARKAGWLAELARAAHLRARLARARGDTTTAVQLFVQAGASARAAKLSGVEGDVRLDLAQLLSDLGSHLEAERELTAVAELHDDESARLFASVLLARSERQRGELGAARARLDSVRREAERSGRRALVATAWQEAGAVEATAGAWGPARAWLRKALEAHVALGTNEVPAIELMLAWVAVELEDVEGARTGIEGARAAYSARGDLALEARALFVEAWLHARVGDWESALTLLRDAALGRDAIWGAWRARFEGHASVEGRALVVQVLRGMG